ncbi:MAG: PEP-CTERM sorting domain-containing protein [Desulfobacterales bacterium]|nr:PEP-CTERM sorting domain-containing protein [Desulfobacterales bacterium]
MKRLFLIGILLLVIIPPVHAADWIIDDSFIGGGYYTNQYPQNKVKKYYQKGGDVISAKKNVNIFDVDEMTVNIDNSGNVTVSIATDYSEAKGLGTEYGDLFISTDGWKPYGDSPYMEDTINKGETWEYVFDTSAFVSGTNQNPIYDTATGTFITSDDVHGGSSQPYHFRHDQEVLFAAGDPGDFSGTGAFYDDVDGILTYAFNLDDLGLSADEAQNLGFRWTMTCANDIIEGGVHWAPVPEPGTMLLLGMGLLGLGALGRKKQARSA